MNYAATVTLWEITDSLLIISANTGVLYQNQTGGTVSNYVECEGYVTAFPFYNNAVFTKEIYDLFSKTGDEGYLSGHSKIVKKLEKLFEEFKINNLIELDMDMLNKSHNQWIYVKIKKGVKNMLIFNEKTTFPLCGVITWSTVVNDLRGDRVEFENINKNTQYIALQKLVLRDSNNDLTENEKEILDILRKKLRL